MESLANYASSSSGSSDLETDNEENTAHLKPVDPSLSVAKSLAVIAAPDVVPMVSSRYVARIETNIYGNSSSLFRIE